MNVKTAFLAISFISLAFASPVFVSPAQADETGEHLMMQLKQASGGAALDRLSGFHEIGTLGQGDHGVTYETWGDFRHLRSVSTMTQGGQKLTRGYDGRNTWTIGPDGEVRTETSPSALAEARLSSYLTIGGYFYPDRFPASFVSRGPQYVDGVSYDVVRVTAEGCAPVDFWLDRESHLLKRLTGMDQGVPFTGVVRRYHEVGGVMIPFEIMQTIGGQQMA